MALLPYAQAVQRFRENEVRADIFVNDGEGAGFYVTRFNVNVETFPHLIARLSANYDLLVADLLAARDTAVAAVALIEGYITEITELRDEILALQTAINLVAAQVAADAATAAAAAAQAGADLEAIQLIQTEINSAIGDVNNTVTVAGDSYTLSEVDINMHIRFTSDVDVTFTIPAYADEPIPLNRSFSYIQVGLGVVTVVAAPGVTLLHPADVTPSPRTRYSSAGMIHVAEDVWDVTGDLSPAA